MKPSEAIQQALAQLQQALQAQRAAAAEVVKLKAAYDKAQAALTAAWGEVCRAHDALDQVLAPAPKKEG